MGFLLEKNEREGPKPPDSNPREYLEPNRSARPAAFCPSSQWHLKRFAQSGSSRPPLRRMPNRCGEIPKLFFLSLRMHSVIPHAVILE